MKHHVTFKEALAHHQSSYTVSMLKPLPSATEDLENPTHHVPEETHADLGDTGEHVTPAVARSHSLC